ncbi:MAG: hypothetical protein H6621_05265 [Halobacteriovoraceae bacterium]|nr:hypothetical protein [Halobacteriovoraceae bacterium]
MKLFALTLLFISISSFAQLGSVIIAVNNDITIQATDLSDSLLIEALNLKDNQTFASLTKDDFYQDTLGYYTFDRLCGLSLITARIVSDDEVLLIFDNFSVLRWNLTLNKAVEIYTDFDPNLAYLCYGIASGVDTYKQYIELDTQKRELTLHRRHDPSEYVVIPY